MILAVALVLPPRSATWLLVGLLGLAVTAALWRWPTAGIVALIPASLLVPVALGTGSESSINAPMLLLLLLTALWLFDMVAVRRQIDIHLSRPELAVLALVAVAVVAFLAGQLVWFPLAHHAPIRAQIGGVMIFVLSAAAFLLAAQRIKTLRALEVLAGTFLLLGTGFAVGHMLPGLKRPLFTVYQFGSTTSQFWTWMVALALGQALFNRRMHPAMRLALAGLALVTLYSSFVVIDGWKSGWVPALATALVLIVLRFPVSLLALALGAITFGQTIADELLASDQYSAETRLEAWTLIGEVVKVNPVLGLGPANYYWYTPLLRIGGYYGLRFNSHNQYVDLIAQIGLVGLAVFGWFVWEIGRFGWRLRQIAPDGFAQGFVNGALAGLAGSLVAGMLGDWILPFVYNVGFFGFRASLFSFLFLGSLVALKKILNRETT
jgi:O-antigen ligase